MRQDELLTRFPSFKLAIEAAPGILEQLVEECPECFRPELNRLVTETARLFHEWYQLGNKMGDKSSYLM